MGPRSEAPALMPCRRFAQVRISDTAWLRNGDLPDEVQSQAGRLQTLLKHSLGAAGASRDNLPVLPYGSLDPADGEPGNPSSLGHTIPATPPAWLTSNTSAAAAWVWRTQRLTGHASYDWHSNGAPLSLGKSTRTPAHRIRPPHARLPRSRRKATRRELDGLTSGSRLRVGRGRGNKTGRLSFTSRPSVSRHGTDGVLVANQTAVQEAAWALLGRLRPSSSSAPKCRRLAGFTGFGHVSDDWVPVLLTGAAPPSPCRQGVALCWLPTATGVKEVVLEAGAGAGALLQLTHRPRAPRGTARTAPRCAEVNASPVRVRGTSPAGNVTSRHANIASGRRRKVVSRDAKLVPVSGWEALLTGRLERLWREHKRVGGAVEEQRQVEEESMVSIDRGRRVPPPSFLPAASSQQAAGGNPSATAAPTLIAPSRPAKVDLVATALDISSLSFRAPSPYPSNKVPTPPSPEMLSASDPGP
ncbi:hypothetical protein PCL_00227 [Purpureocillium lilacinum]|uniref:Uncharacterized protein n=1 Tax=Purpureocillium lilacinum TaxID=33203 RepID=A0A2U3E6G3_PURLI|nr:hypothetical protein PCL_00227 [Purpureocillium lilacinum]